MLPTLVDLVDQQNLFRLVFECRFNLSVEVALFLEIVDQVLLTLLHQIAIDRSFGIDWDQFSYLQP